jgi:putative two-component system response regulator
MTKTTANCPILIVDDDPQNLAALRHVLGHDYPLAFANNGYTALKAVRRLAPALILMDIQMPGMDGYQVCRELKSDPLSDHIPVIFVSSLSEIGNEAEGFAAGAVDYITKPVSPPIVRARVRAHLSLVQASRLEQSYRDAITMLGTAGHYNDTDTGVHIWRMAAYARRLAEACGWQEDDCRILETAAPMHDTGKIGIPSDILRKPAKLDAEEWEVMKTHTRIGYDILCQGKGPVFSMAAEVALRHHEKWDGSGYPDGLAGEAIPESARIVALADVFDALTMKRPYKDPWPPQRAMETIQESAGSHFEPRLVRHFEAILPDILAIKLHWDQRGEQ